MSATLEPVMASDLRSRLRRSTQALLALACTIAAGALMTALASYAPADPSFNTATALPPTNLAGLPGAVLADLLLQGFGIAAILPVLTLLGWAWRIAAGRGLTLPPMRILALLVAMPLLGSVACGIPGLDGSTLPWPSTAGLGGAMGRAVSQSALAVGQTLLGPLGVGLIWAASAALAAFLAIWAMGLGRSEWNTASRFATSGARNVAHGTSIAGKGLSHLGQAASWLARLVNGTPSSEPPRIVGQHTDPPPIRARLTSHEALPALKDTGASLPKATPQKAAPPIATPGKPTPQITMARPAAPMQKNLPLQESAWRFPTLDLLTPAPARSTIGALTEAEMQEKAALLVTVLADYGVQGQITGIHPGPVVTLYELEPAPGTRAARVIGLADDVARSLSVIAVRVAVVPGRSVLGIEVPNAQRETVYLSEIIASDSFQSTKGKLVLTLGKDISGAPILADLATMPHLLVAGTTGSGKSVGINAMILSLLFKLSPSQCRLIMIDPKMLELSIYEGIPHLMAPVVTEPAKAVTVLKWTVREMERRYRTLQQLNVRNIAGYNARVQDAAAKGEIVIRRVQTGFDSETGKPVFEEQNLALEMMPHIVLVIDEMADLMMVAGKDIEITVMRLAQMARAAGIHVIMATQRPSVDVITGTIKANFPTRISFRVVSKFDSRTILQEQGAEQLLGQGDMLFQKDGRTTRVHGPFVSDQEVEEVVAFLREQGEPDYKDEIFEEPDQDGQSAMSGIAGASDSDKSLFDQAVDVVTREGKASTSFVQRHLNIGYNKAAKLIEQMEKEGVIGPANHVGKREVLTRRPRSKDEDDNEM